MKNKPSLLRTFTPLFGLVVSDMWRDLKRWIVPFAFAAFACATIYRLGVAEGETKRDAAWTAALKGAATELAKEYRLCAR